MLNFKEHMPIVFSYDTVFHLYECFFVPMFLHNGKVPIILFSHGQHIWNLLPG